MWKLRCSMSPVSLSTWGFVIVWAIRGGFMRYGEKSPAESCAVTDMPSVKPILGGEERKSGEGNGSMGADGVVLA